jgi:hypothetical protein
MNRLPLAEREPGRRSEQGRVGAACLTRPSSIINGHLLSEAVFQRKITYGEKNYY